MKHLLFLLFLSSYLCLHQLDISGEWDITNKNGTLNLKGNVPGDIYSDLIREKIIDDPYYRFNDLLYRWVGLDEWAYKKTVQVSADIIKEDRVVLICEGLDTVGTVIVNGHVVGNVDNMFRKYSFDVKQWLHVGENSIVVEFQSASTVGVKRAEDYPYAVPLTTYVNGQPGRNFVRKEQSSFGWDWGPSFVPQGIWRPISLMAYTGSFIDSVAVNVVKDASKSVWKVNVNVDFFATQKVTGSLKLDLEGITSKSFPVPLNTGNHNYNAILEIPIDKVELWWPNGYGSPKLYQLKIDWLERENQFSETKNVGFRTIELVKEPLAKGLSFYFKVNDIPIFAKGANFIPVDSFQGRISEENLTSILTDSVTVHMNIVRNWGGGIYQVDEFYDLCDSLGLMVWEEFMFGCAMYPRNEEFLNSVREEVKYQTRRLMHHASIAIWSGNNENEVALHWYPETRANRDLYVVDQVALYVDTIRPAILENDNSRPFVVSSPSNGELVDEPYVLRWGDGGSDDYGDVHYYDYKSICTDFTLFPTARFVSEYGYQSFPSLQTWLPVTKPEDLIFNSTLMQHRQHHPGGTEEILKQLSYHFVVSNHTDNPAEFFKDFVYLSQIQQAICIKAQTEYYRRLKGSEYNTMGAIYWQLNQIWQAPSWSSLEFGGRWKMLHYYAKHFFADVLITGFESDEHSENNLNVQIVSDQNKPISGKFDIIVYTIDGIQVNSVEKPFDLKNLESKKVFTLPVESLICPNGHCYSRNEVFFILRAEDNLGSAIAENTYFLSPLANSNIPRAKLEISNIKSTSPKAITFTVQTSATSFYTWLETPTEGRFSENGFLLIPSHQRQIIFYANEEVSVDTFSKSLTATTLSDTL